MKTTSDTMAILCFGLSEFQSHLWTDAVTGDGLTQGKASPLGTLPSPIPILFVQLRQPDLRPALALLYCAQTLWQNALAMLLDKLFCCNVLLTLVALAFLFLPQWWTLDTASSHGNMHATCLVHSNASVRFFKTCTDPFKECLERIDLTNRVRPEEAPST